MSSIIVWEKDTCCIMCPFAHLPDALNRAPNRILLPLYVGGFDDRPPFFNVSLLQCAKRFGRLLLARGNLVSEVGKLLSNACVAQGTHDRIVEFRDDVPWRTARRENRVP